MGHLVIPAGVTIPSWRRQHLDTIDVDSLPGDYYPYECWVEAGFPISGPAAAGFGPGPDRIDTDVCHYAAAYYSNGSENVGMVRKLRAENRDYWLNRNPGYALGYNHQGDRHGNCWECRGWLIRNAANSTVAPNFNIRSMSMHLVVSKLNSIPTDSQAETANDKQIALMQWYRREQRRRAGFELALLGHRDTKPTGCPGSGIYFQIWSTDVFDIDAPIVIDPQPPAVFLPEEDDMTVITRWEGEPFDIEVSPTKPGTLQRVWRGIDPNDAGKLIAAGLAWDHRGDPLPLSLKGDFNAAPPQYQRVG